MIILPEATPQPIAGVQLQPQTSEETFGGGPGLSAENQEIQKIAQTAGEIGGFERIRANQTAVQDATAKLAAVHTNLLSNPETGLPAYQGVNAMAGQDKLWTQFQKSANDISNGLSGQEQKGAFNKIAVAMGDAFNQHVKAHVAQEMEKHDANSFESLVKNLSDASGKTYGNAQGLDLNYKILTDAATARAQRLGLDDSETQKFMRTVKSVYHEEVLGQMVNDPNFIKQTKQYFSDHRDEMDSSSQDRIRDLIDLVPQQQEKMAKEAQTEFYKSNMRQAMLDMLDGKMTLSEVDRRFRENQLDKSDYDILAGRLSKPDAGLIRSTLTSDPPTFNAIRQAQLTGSASSGEIQRMIAKAAAAKKLAPDDGKYLITVNNDSPPTARDKYVEGAASNVRDFAQRYFAETNFFGHPTNQDKTSQETESLVQDFYSSVDKAKANKGDDIDDIRDRVIKTAMQKRFPGLGNLEKAPDVVIDIKGKVTRLLNPDDPSALKPRYKIAPIGPSKNEDS